MTEAAEAESTRGSLKAALTKTMPAKILLREPLKAKENLITFLKACCWKSTASEVSNQGREVGGGCYEGWTDGVAEKVRMILTYED